MIKVWFELAKFVMTGFAIGLGVGIYLAWDINKEKVRANFESNWKPFFIELMEKYD